MPLEPLSPCLEIVSFTLASGHDVASLTARAKGIMPWLEKQPGFVARTLVGPDEGGRYLDIVRWQSLTEAQQAAEKAMAEPAFGAFMEAIDEASVRMQHLPIRL
ncbi:MAG: hypothetical protein KA712_20560 [Myxococcales bacterium]|nr:hypothetical protein [Myxococcales bacterium]